MSSVSTLKESIDPEPELSPIPNGPAAAAILAGGIGSAFYGLVTVLAEAIKGIGNALNWYKPSGPLSGKTGVGVLGFILAWVILANLWKDKDVAVDKVWKVTVGLILLGLLFTFPPFFLAFVPK